MVIAEQIWAQVPVLGLALQARSMLKTTKEVRVTLYRVTTKGSVISADFANFEPYQSSRRLQFSLEQVKSKFKLDSCERLMQLVNYEDTI